MLKFILIVSKQGQTRLAQYYDERRETAKRSLLEADLIRKVLSRGTKVCSFLDYQDFKVIYRRYLSLYFLIGIDKEENEVAILEFIHLIVETLDRYFPKVTDLDPETLSSAESSFMLLLREKYYLAKVGRVPVKINKDGIIMFNLDKLYMILDEMVMNGCIVETSKTKVLEPIKLIDQHR